MVLDKGVIDRWNKELESTNERKNLALDTSQTGQDHPLHNHKYQNQPVSVILLIYFKDFSSVLG